VKSLKPTLKTLSTSRTGPVATERIRGSTGQAIRKRIMERDGWICRLCYPERITPGDVVDHIVPLHLGGAESDENRMSL
jgi:5-methylcytosine-specific restriction endonuclease McrA